MSRTIAWTRALAPLALLVACTGATGGADPGVAPDVVATDPGQDATPDTASDLPSDTVPGAPGTCAYADPVTQADACKAYGTGWAPATARADCEAALPGPAGTWSATQACPASDVLGTCSLTDGQGRACTVVLSGADAFRCNLVRTACLVGAAGTFEPGPVCQGLGDPTAAWGAVPFVQPYRMCIDAKAGEPAGLTDGHVCTWTLISACTEPGRRFDDQAYCPDVITQRPYAPATATPTAANDPRLSDAAYMAEVAWAGSQVEACGCACCHTKRLAPNGPANWHIDATGIWTDGIRDSGLALMLNKADSRALGAFPSEQNNGFDRTQLGLPTSDVPRMKKFLQAEWDRRGLTDAYGVSVPAFGGPLVEQLSFTPDACTGGEGVAADGSIYWGGGDARYLYILSAGSKGPVVPPNLDRPEGTLWRIDAPNVSEPFQSAVYGVVSGDQRQVIPASGAPPALVSGTQYYIYALVDVGLPSARCLFTAP